MRNSFYSANPIQRIERSLGDVTPPRPPLHDSGNPIQRIESFLFHEPSPHVCIRRNPIQRIERFLQRSWKLYSMGRPNPIQRIERAGVKTLAGVLTSWRIQYKELKAGDQHIADQPVGGLESNTKNWKEVWNDLRLSVANNQMNPIQRIERQQWYMAEEEAHTRS